MPPVPPQRRFSTEGRLELSLAQSPGLNISDPTRQVIATPAKSMITWVHSAVMCKTQWHGLDGISASMAWVLLCAD